MPLLWLADFKWSNKRNNKRVDWWTYCINKKDMLLVLLLVFQSFMNLPRAHERAFIFFFGSAKQSPEYLKWYPGLEKISAYFWRQLLCCFCFSCITESILMADSSQFHVFKERNHSMRYPLGYYWDTVALPQCQNHRNCRVSFSFLPLKRSWK